MASVLLFFSRYAVPIFVLLGIGLFFSIRNLLRARREMGGSFYGLEREISRRHITQAIAVFSLIVFLGVAEMVLTIFLTPNMPAFSFLVSPTMNPLITPSTTIPPELLSTMGIQTPLSTETVQTTGCIPGQIMISSPKPGDVIKGEVKLIGTADIPNFGFYKYEFSPLGTDSWSTIQANRKVKQDAELGTWDTSEITPGDYNLRLVVINNQGNPFPPCIVPLRVAAP
jgi:hypothetical protein